VEITPIGFVEGSFCSASYFHNTKQDYRLPEPSSVSNPGLVGFRDLDIIIRLLVDVAAARGGIRRDHSQQAVAVTGWARGEI
jgi:hypothetical protein